MGGVEGGGIGRGGGVVAAHVEALHGGWWVVGGGVGEDTVVW